jgi:branched-chain amino acid transport system ATP-binding protein
MTAMLDVAGLELAYGKVLAVKGIDLAVREGEVVCLIGANGAGKTTTLRGLSGLLRPRGGSIRFKGAEIGRLAPHRLARAGIMHVPEGRQVFAQMTVEANLAMGGYLVADTGKRRALLANVLERFPRLAERLSQPAGLLSGGEQQMLAMGRALMSDPKLLLLDEPSMGLAPLFVEQVFRLIRQLKQDGRTILLVEQNARLALDVADRAYVLANGRISLQGQASAIATDPSVLRAYLGQG